MADGVKFPGLRSDLNDDGDRCHEEAFRDLGPGFVTAQPWRRSPLKWC